MSSMSRAEVEAIAKVVEENLEALEPGCQYTICGGYRRGKTICGDVDIIATHPDRHKYINLCDRLVKRLQKGGIVTHVWHHSSFASGHTAAPRSRKFGSSKQTKFDSLDKALTTFRLPSGYLSPTSPAKADQNQSVGPTQRNTVQVNSDCSIKISDGNEGVSAVTFDPETPYRRVDLVFAPPEAYWTAVVGWTGSTQFERDIRLWANQVGLHFDSTGICRLSDTTPIYARSEQDVFDILGLEYVDPTLRNADL
ncbi:hypothetical protein FRB93_005600 [Tulasnella sp. JGI-2019a]|nr:hypothetical protein FRB93_005600 [Tulasnella sp. JGI-2019a]